MLTIILHAQGPAEHKEIIVEHGSSSISGDHAGGAISNSPALGRRLSTAVFPSLHSLKYGFSGKK